MRFPPPLPPFLAKGHRTFDGMRRRDANKAVAVTLCSFPRCQTSHAPLPWGRHHHSPGDVAIYHRALAEWKRLALHKQHERHHILTEVSSHDATSELIVLACLIFCFSMMFMHSSENEMMAFTLLLTDLKTVPYDEWKRLDRIRKISGAMPTDNVDGSGGKELIRPSQK